MNQYSGLNYGPITTTGARRDSRASRYRHLVNREVSRGNANVRDTLDCICLSPSNDVLADQVDLVEINHFYDEQGRLVLDQIIFYDWSAAQARYQVRAWRLLKTPAQIPRRDWNGKQFVAIWHDGDTLRKVRANQLRESWTQYDPELVEQQYLAKEKRVELRRVRP